MAFAKGIRAGEASVELSADQSKLVHGQRRSSARARAFGSKGLEPHLQERGAGSMMRVEALVTCVNYADFLRITLPLLAPQVDRVAVVTAPQDEPTHRVARSCGAEVHATEAFFAHNASFNKGLALREADQKCLRRDGWVLFTDADVALPPWMRERMAEATDPEGIYGAVRHMAYTPRDWAAVGADRSEWNLDHLERWDHETHVPGYFQLVCGSSPQRYPTNWKHAGGCDTIFTKGFPREKRYLLPGWDVVHLGVHGTNWHGRLTETWGRDVGETRYSADQIRKRRQRYEIHRRRRGGSRARV